MAGWTSVRPKTMWAGTKMALRIAAVLKRVCAVAIFGAFAEEDGPKESVWGKIEDDSVVVCSGSGQIGRLTCGL